MAQGSFLRPIVRRPSKSLRRDGRRRRDKVFITTANYTFAQPLSSNKPYADKGFVVFRKGGDGAILLTKQATNMTLVGNTTNLAELT